MPVESTLCLVKPDAFDRAERIVDVLKRNDFVVAEREVISLTKERAAEFYKEHAERSFYNDLLAFMSSGSILALILRREDAIRQLRTTLGPTDSEKARVDAPDSIRALFGTDNQRNAAHGSDSPASAAREIKFFFPAHTPIQASGKAAKEWLARSIAPTLTKALTEMCRLMPQDPEQWLSEYLLKSKGVSPRIPAQSVAPVDEPAPGASTTAADKIVASTGDASSEPAVPKVYFVLGNAGSGKGSQCAKLVEKYGFAHLSAGDLLRAEVKSGSDQGEMISELIREGKIVPGEVTLNLIKAAIRKCTDKPGILIDGFPRELTQAGGFEKEVSGFEFALFFDCPEEELERRLLGRGETSGRTDDNIESIRKRFATFKSTCYPVIEYYEAKGVAHRIDATKSIDEVFAEVDRLFSA